MKFMKWLGGAAIALAGTVANANTITVDSLTNLGAVTIGSQNYEQYVYNARLSDEGSVVNSYDQFSIANIQGFVGFGTTINPSPVTLTGAAGTTWNVTATTVGIFTTITAIYTGNVGYVPGPRDPLLNITFTDIYKNKAPNLATWSSQDHNMDGTGVEIPLTGQFISAPDPTSGAPGTPTPVAGMGGLALLGVLGMRRHRKA